MPHKISTEQTDNASSLVRRQLLEKKMTLQEWIDKSGLSKDFILPLRRTFPLRISFIKTVMAFMEIDIDIYDLIHALGLDKKVLEHPIQYPHNAKILQKYANRDEEIFASRQAKNVYLRSHQTEINAMPLVVEVDTPVPCDVVDCLNGAHILQLNYEPVDASWIVSSLCHTHTELLHKKYQEAASDVENAIQFLFEGKEENKNQS